jgi:sugar porter (SP) family MFS transporter
MAVVTGILMAYIVNFLFKDVADEWRWMLGLAAVPGAALAVGMLTVPRTPRWLAAHGRHDRAQQVLEELRSGDDDADVDAELEEIEEADRSERESSVRTLFGPRLRPMLVIGVMLALAQQLVGVNTVIYYAPTILSDTGLTNAASLAGTLVVGVTNVVFTAIAVLLLDRVGRRVLLNIGTSVLIVALLVLAVYFSSSTLQDDYGWLALGGLVLFIAGFAIGLGPVFWLMISEIFPGGVRSKAMSVTTVCNWGANFVVAQTFLTLSGWITRQGVFFLYAGLAVLALVFFILRVPETRGKSLEEIQQDVAGDRA